MKEIIYKTNHFWQRAWERGFHQFQIENLISNVNPSIGKSVVIFGKESLKNAGIKVPNSSHLVIVMKEGILITIFTVPDLFYFLKSISRKANILMF